MSVTYPRIVREATSPNTYNVTLTVADTEYSQALPANTKRFSVQARTAVDVRHAFVTGKVAAPTAPYNTLKANGSYYEDKVQTNATIYLASSTAGTVVEIIAWTE